MHLNDPALGRRKVSLDEFDEMFTGVAMTFSPKPEFEKIRERNSTARLLFKRTEGFRLAIFLVLSVTLLLIIPGLVLPVLSRIFVDEILVNGYADWLTPLLLGFALTAIVRFILTEIQRTSLTRAHAALASRGARDLLQHLLKLPLSYFGARYTGDIASRVQLPIELASLVTGQIAQVVLNALTAIFFVVLMVIYSPIVAAAVVALAALTLLVVFVSTGTASEMHRKLSIENSKLEGITLSGFEGYRNLQVGRFRAGAFPTLARHQDSNNNNAAEAR